MGGESISCTITITRLNLSSYPLLSNSEQSMNFKSAAPGQKHKQTHRSQSAAHGHTNIICTRRRISLVSAGREVAGVQGRRYSAAPDPLDVPTPASWLHTRSHQPSPLNTCAMPVRRCSFGKLSQQRLPEPLDLSVARVRLHGRSSGSPPAHL